MGDARDAPWETLPPRYQPLLVRRGDGVFGSVRDYLDTVTGAVVAVKRVGDLRLTRVKKLLREIRICTYFSSIATSHVVPLLDVVVVPATSPPPTHDPGEEDPNAVFFVMPSALCSLDLLLRHWAAPAVDIPATWPPQLAAAVRARDPELARVLSAQIAAGLHIFHSANILHRDIKPANVLIFAQPPPPAAGVPDSPYLASARAASARFGAFASVADYGWARGPSDTGGLTPDHVIPLSYRPPEVLVAGRAYSTPVDVWSLGVLMAEWFLPPVRTVTIPGVPPELPPDRHLFTFIRNVPAQEVLRKVLEVVSVPSFAPLVLWMTRLVPTNAHHRRQMLAEFWAAKTASPDAIRVATRVPRTPDQGAAARQAQVTSLRRVRDVHAASLARPRFDQEPPPGAPFDPAVEAAVAAFAPRDVPPEAAVMRAVLEDGGAPPEAVHAVYNTMEIIHTRRPSARQVLELPWLAPVAGDAAVAFADVAAAECARLQYADTYDDICLAEQAWWPQNYRDFDARHAQRQYSTILARMGAAFAARRDLGTPLPADLFAATPTPAGGHALVYGEEAYDMGMVPPEEEDKSPSADDDSVIMWDDQ